MTEESSIEREPQPCEIGRALLDDAEFAAMRMRLAVGGRRWRGLAARIAIQRAMLQVVGERGWEKATVEEVVELSGANRARFYSSFGTKEGCYASAYDSAIDALAARLLASCDGASDWTTGLHLALLELAQFLDTERTLAVGLLSEAAGVGAAVADKHDEVFGRLSRAIDHARRETVESRHQIPPFTPRFILSGFEVAVLRFLGSPRGLSFKTQVPGLLYLAIDYYLGAAAARSEVRRLTGGEGG